MIMDAYQLHSLAARQSSAFTDDEKIILAALSAKNNLGITGFNEEASAALKAAYKNEAGSSNTDIDFIAAKTAIDQLINDTLARSEHVLGEDCYSYPFVLGVLSQLMVDYVVSGKIPNAIEKYISRIRIISA